MLMYLILAWYRGHLRVEKFCMEPAAESESSFFGWVDFQVQSEQLGKDIYHMFDGVEKTIDQFFRVDARLMPDGGKWKRSWAVNTKWVPFISCKKRCTGFLPPAVVSSTSTVTKQVCVQQR